MILFTAATLVINTAMVSAKRHVESMGDGLSLKVSVAMLVKGAIAFSILGKSADEIRTSCASYPFHWASSVSGEG